MIKNLNEICRKIETALPVSTFAIMREFDLLEGHPWREVANSEITNYYACLYGIVENERPRKILEIGTAFGMSAAAILKATKEIVELFVTIDLGIYGKQLGAFTDNIEFARSKIYKWCQNNGVNTENVYFFRANTQPKGKGDNENEGTFIQRWHMIPEIVRLLQCNEFDVIFIDGKHTEDGLLNDLQTFWPFLRPGGLIICDDIHNPKIYKGLFQWVGDTWHSFHSFIEQKRSEIDDYYIWNFPHVPPAGKSGDRPFGLIRKSSIRYPLKKSSNFYMFDSPEAMAINFARLDHLASLGIDLFNKTVLEVGAGVGWHTAFFEKLNCYVFSTDGKPGNVAEHLRRYPYRKGRVGVADLSKGESHGFLGEFDIVYCYDTLHHVSNPALCIKELSSHCRELFLLETCVNHVDNGDINLINEDRNNPNQSCEGIGCRPGRDWVISELKKYFPYVYLTVKQPAHPDFPLHWPADVEKNGLARAVFVASRKPLNLPSLTDRILSHQLPLEPVVPSYRVRPAFSCNLDNYFKINKDSGKIILPPGTKRIWIDVGAHECETTLPYLHEFEDLILIAFEPLPDKWQKLYNKHPRLIALPFAIAPDEGIVKFYRTENNVSSSLLEINPEGFERWRNKRGLEVIEVLNVPTMRLETLLNLIPLDYYIEFLKVDARGYDLEVVRSAGRHLHRIEKVKMEVAVTPVQLYKNAKTKDEVVSFMEKNGFSLYKVETQSDGQEENLTFVNVGKRNVRNRDVKLGFTPAQAYWNQRQTLKSLSKNILVLADAVDRKTDLGLFQWAQLMAVALEFRPDLILELGRWRGNSTCAFTEAANYLCKQGHDCNVVSLCNSSDWENLTIPRLLRVVGEEWFRPLRAIKGNILNFDYESLLKDVNRCLVFWDAHGYDVAECVLGRILPLIAPKPHIVIMHDLLDARYCPEESSLYKGNRLWRGNNWNGPRIRLGNIISAVEQAVSIVDFASRNNIVLDSADHSFAMEIKKDIFKLKEMKDILGEELFSLSAHWFWFTLYGMEGPITFPACPFPVTRDYIEIDISCYTRILGVSLDKAIRSNPDIIEVIPRINMHIRAGRTKLASRMIEKELGPFEEKSKILARLHT